jgi:hypothetical protein
MKTRFASPLLALSLLLLPSSLPAELFSDALGEIDPGIANAGGTLDIMAMEVTNTATDIVFTLTLNGNIATTDWGNFMIGIATGGTGTTTGNGWGRPINMNSPGGGMDYWIGSWVNAGGGSQLWAYDGSGWNLMVPAPSKNFSAGSNSTLTHTVSLSSLGLALGDSFYFDAYSTGGGGTDSAVDALSNPNVSITGWSGPYTSNTTNGISQYTVVPEPSIVALVVASGVILIGFLRRRKAH